LQLSIIIVNYNVKHFLEQCLYTVQNAVKELDAEIIVVDNHSSDGSMGYLQPLFPSVRFIVNEQNLGFAKANNQALAVCGGEYVLFLNPDTLVPEDCLQKSLAFIERSAAGAIGTRMLDGRGRFLPESKRSFPTPLVSFYKLSGLASLFPTSGIFNKYALGHLGEFQNHRVEVLAGAFMLVKRELLNRLNGFDENYFLYGEDIDLSFRMQQAGFANFYFAGTGIIHFKGESSGKKSLNRVKFFYRAMLVFVQNHYRTGSGKLFSAFLKLAIALRGSVSACKRILKPVLWPLADGMIIWVSLLAIKTTWINTVRNGKDFGVPFISYALPAFSLLFILCAAFTGLYDRKNKTSKTLLSVAFGTLGMLAVYALLPETIRFSRGVILWGGILGGMLIFLLRQFLITDKEEEGQTVIVATKNEYAAINELLERSLSDQQILGRISPGDHDENTVCEWKDLLTLQKNIAVNKIIFCIGTVPLSEAMKQMQLLGKKNIRFLFHVSGSGSIVGSHTLAPGAAIVTPLIDYRIEHPYQKRMKRVVDLSVSLFLLITIPVHLFIHPRTGRLARNIFHVLAGNRTWVGYASTSTLLPAIKAGAISQTVQNLNKNLLEKTDKRYAKNYDWWDDLVIIFKNYRRL